MGEESGQRGKFGEDKVIEFLNLIGWYNPVKNIDFECFFSEKHKKENSKERKTHGIDAYFSYKSPMIAKTLENILISTKYKNYPNNPIKEFKENYEELAKAIECFKQSERMKTIKKEYSPIDIYYNRGIIFMLSETPSQNILQKVCNIETTKEFNHNGIFLIDNEKFNFFYNSIMFFKNMYSRPIEFVYFNNGLNEDNKDIKGGIIMPIQYLSSNIIPLKAYSGEKNILILCSKEEFERDTLIKLINLAKNIVTTFQSETIIAFPNYEQLQHENIVNEVKQIFENILFVNNLTIKNFNKQELYGKY